MSLPTISYITQRSCSPFPPASTAKKGKSLYKPGRCQKTKCGGNSYKHIPHRLKPAHLVAKRNARERKRVQAVNSAFFKLRKHVPHEARHSRLSKVKTLRSAIEYIQHLQKLIEKHDRHHSDAKQTTRVSPHCSHYHDHNFCLNQDVLETFSGANSCLAEMSLPRESNTEQTSSSCPEAALFLTADVPDTSKGLRNNNVLPSVPSFRLKSPNCPLDAVEPSTDSLCTFQTNLQSRNFETTYIDDYVLSQETRLSCTVSVYQFDRVARPADTQLADLVNITYQAPLPRCQPCRGRLLSTQASVPGIACKVLNLRPAVSATPCFNQTSNSPPVSPCKIFLPSRGAVSSRVLAGGQAAPSCPSHTRSLPVNLSRMSSTHGNDYSSALSASLGDNQQEFSLFYSRPVPSVRQPYTSSRHNHLQHPP